VEIDPMVHRLATKYFSLPENYTIVIQDAVTFVQDGRKTVPSLQFDYIIHDVFTGGAEPADLFTVEFMKNLHALLKEDGVVAIVRSSFLLVT
jgi:spermidine synthase